MIDKQTLNRWEKRKIRTKQLLKETTLEILLEKGFTELTIQEIADCADLSRGTFYLHFASLEEIVWTIVQDSLDSTTQEVLSSFQEMPYKQRKYHIWKRIFEYAQEHRLILKVLFGEKGHPHFAKQIENYFTSIIYNSIQTGIFTPDLPDKFPVEFASQFVTGSLVRLMIWSLDTDYSPEQLGQYYYEILFREAMPEDYREFSSDE